MPDAATSQVTSVPVAGICLEHELRRGIRFSTSSPWTDIDGCVDAPIRIEHDLGSTSTCGLRETLRVNERTTYFADQDGRTAISLGSPDATSPTQLVRTLESGCHYRVDYEFTPVDPVDRRHTELTIFTLALGARMRGLMAHGCGFVCPDGGVALCVGMSGAGKSTLGRLVRDEVGLHVLNDDRIAITPENDRFHAWGTPWPGRAGIASPGDGALCAIGVIGRAPSFRSRRLLAREARGALLTTLALPLWENAGMIFGLEMLDQLLSRVPVYEIAYPVSRDSAFRIVETLSETKA